MDVIHDQKKMKTVQERIRDFEQHQYDERLMELYGDKERLENERARYIRALKMYESLYGNEPVRIYSAAGRSEVSGNHTDHQHGRVLAASITLDTIAIA
ncbi:galactokinase family protein, partial [uncultured Dubosiella sp.]|uniref:galactokinase family protein n=1 Tax=uncultured Dubosiella sp. TaxID=1937011 RepID=UPI0026246A99